MFALHTFTTTLAFLSFSVQAFPLVQRDVAAPPILQPNSSSVWVIGTLQLVIWNTTDLPAQITNPIGQIILGFNESNSLNLDFNNPLAQGFNLTDGNVTVTVPNVPPRDDYLVVLFGDSGDSSPAFAITSITPPASGSSSLPASSSSILAPSSSASVSSSSASASASLSSTPMSSGSIPDSSSTTSTSLSVTDSAATAALAETNPTGTDTTASLSTATSPTGATTIGFSTSISNGSNSGSSSSSSSSGSAVISALATSTSSNSAGWSLHHSSSMWSSVVAPFLMSVTPLVIVFMV